MRMMSCILVSFCSQNFYTELANLFRDISTNNILQGIEDNSVLCQIEQDEMMRPVARKILNDRQIYFSRPVPLSTGLPVLSDFGEALSAKPNNEAI